MLSVSANAECFLWVQVLFWNLAVLFCTLFERPHRNWRGWGTSIPFTAQTLAWHSYKSQMMKGLVAMWHFRTRCLETDVPLPEEEARIQLLGSLGQWSASEWEEFWDSHFMETAHLRKLEEPGNSWPHYATLIQEVGWITGYTAFSYLFLCPKNWDGVKSPCVLGGSTWVNSGFLFVFKLPIMHPTHYSFS